MDEQDATAPTAQLLNRKAAAAYLTGLGLEIAAQTLARKFHEGTGPLCTHVADRAMYWRHHLDAWFQEQLSAPRRCASEPRVPAMTPANGPASVRPVSTGNRHVRPVDPVRREAAKRRATAYAEARMNRDAPTLDLPF